MSFSAGQVPHPLAVAQRRHVDTIAALKAAPLQNGGSVLVLGYHAPGDGGGGVFFFDSASLATDDGGLVIERDAGGAGRWLREVEGFVSVRAYGAKGDGVTDDRAAIQTWLNAGGGDFVAGDYLIGDSLVIPSRTRMVGPHNIWSNGSRTAVIIWDGAAGGAVIQCAENPVGTPSDAATGGILLKDFLIDGDDVAGIGFYGNYISDGSTIEGVSATKCNLFGFLLGKLWYSHFRDLVARNCNGIGIAIGKQWQASFDDLAVNAVVFENIRAAACGVEYDESTAPTGFDLTTNAWGGCGVLLCLQSSSGVTGVTGENCYGPGVTIEPNVGARCFYDGVYVEGNCPTVVADGAAPSRIGLLLINETSEIRTQFIRAFYGHPGSDNDRVRYQQGSNGAGDFVFEHAYNTKFSSNVAGVIPISAYHPRGTTALENDALLATRLSARRLLIEPSGAQVFNRHAAVESAAARNQSGWASEDTLDLAQVRLRPQAQNRGAAASVLMHLTWFASSGSGNPTHIIAQTWLVTMTALQRHSSSVTTAFTAVLLGSTSSNSGGSRITPGDLSVAFDVSDIADIVATIQATPTSTGTAANNDVAVAVQLMGGGARLGVAPSLLAPV